MRVLLIGSEGNMGRRYQAVLRSLGVPFDRYDVKIDGRVFPLSHLREGVTHVLIATPTESHIADILNYRGQDLSVLCEKPLSTQIHEVRNLQGDNLSMVCQYRHLLKPAEQALEGDSLYDYYRHGQDGIVWDCIQIIGLSNPRTSITLRSTSPIWKCVINDQELDISQMDLAYVLEVSAWLQGNALPLDEVIEMHERTYSFEQSAIQTYHRGPSQNRELPLPQ